jgi:hypothetical protein
MANCVLGFHLRFSPHNLQPWDTERKSTYLLREDITTPLSVDRSVWPQSDNKNLYFELFSNYSAAPNSAPNGLNLFDLLSPSHIAHTSLRTESFLIALTISSNVGARLKSKHFIEESSIGIGDLTRANWMCLGFDVANDWLCSGLMNCGYRKDDKAALSKRYRGELNEFGLFISEQAASSFCASSDTRVPEHAPFTSYGIWANGKP